MATTMFYSLVPDSCLYLSLLSFHEFCLRSAKKSSFSRNDYVIWLACAEQQKVTSKLVSPSCSPTMSDLLQYSDLFYVFSFRRKVT